MRLPPVYAICHDANLHSEARCPKETHAIPFAPSTRMANVSAPPLNPALEITLVRRAVFSRHVWLLPTCVIAQTTEMNFTTWCLFLVDRRRGRVVWGPYVGSLHSPLEHSRLRIRGGRLPVKTRFSAALVHAGCTGPGDFDSLVAGSLHIHADRFREGKGMQFIHNLRRHHVHTSRGIVTTERGD